MTVTNALVALGAVLTVISPWVTTLEQWGPLLALWTAGGAHLAWIVRREERAARRGDARRAA